MGIRRNLSWGKELERLWQSDKRKIKQRTKKFCFYESYAILFYIYCWFNWFGWISSPIFSWISPILNWNMSLTLRIRFNDCEIRLSGLDWNFWKSD